MSAEQLSLPDNGERSEAIRQALFGVHRFGTVEYSEASSTIGKTRSEVLMSRKPTLRWHGKCTGASLECPSGHNWEIMRFKTFDAYLVDNKVVWAKMTSVQGKQADETKTSKLEKVLTGVAVGLAITQQTYFAYYCPQVRRIPLLFINANQYQFLQACIAAGY